MVAAANADGHIDRDERERIMQRVQTLCLAAEKRAMVFYTVASPLSLTNAPSEHRGTHGAGSLI
jgi:uncharacterized membrane protein YebE (DUF533 family)